MIPSQRHLSLAFSAAGLVALALAAAVTLRADQAMSQVQVETRTIVSDGGMPVPPGMGPAGNAPMKPGTGLIVGQTLDAGSSRPVAGALVTLTVPGTQPLRVLSDGQGRFAFRDLPKGNFNLSASKGGFVDGAFGRLRPQGQTQPVELQEGGQVGGANVSLWKYGAIAGQLTDEAGEPMVGASVRVLRKTIQSGKPQLTMGRADTTDDRGLYRISQLEPGEYIVAVPVNSSTALRMAAVEELATFRAATVAMAAPAVAAGGGGSFNLSFDDMPMSGGDGRAPAYPTVFYPMALSASRAAIIPIGSGEERGSIDFRLQPQRSMRLGGTALSTAGPAANLTLTLIPAEADGLISPLETMNAGTDAAGKFVFPSVVPGNYVLRAMTRPGAFGPAETVTFSGGNVEMVTVTRTMAIGGAAPPLPADNTLWAQVPVTIGAEDIPNLVVSLNPGIKISGTVDWQGAGAKPGADVLPRIQVTVEPADARTQSGGAGVRGRVETSGTFATTGAAPGRYFVRAANAPQGWFFRGAMLNGRDVTDLPLDLDSGDASGVTLVFTDKQTELTGTVTTTDGAADPAAAVIVFPAERETWTGYGTSPRRLRNVRPDAKGAYTIRGLPSGRYYVAATKEATAADWQDPKFLEGLASAASLITIGEGQKASQSLKVVR